MPALSGARVVVTGATRGIGRALALAFAGEGACLLLHGRSPDDLTVIAAEARSAGAAGVTVVSGDLLDAGLGGRLRAGAESLGGLELVILSAAELGPMSALAATPLEAFERVLRVGVTAQVAVYQALRPAVSVAPGGAFVWVSSGLGRFGVERYGAYCAAKHAVEGVMKVAALEDAAAGIVHVAVAPGMVQTDMLRRALGQDDVSGYETPERTAAGFVRLARALGREQAGASLDIEPWLPLR